MSLGLFDTIAESYNVAAPSLPSTFVNRLQDTFHIQKEDRILDLGCGSGNLALKFSALTPYVEGVDSSSVMIQAAKKNDSQKKIKWYHSSVEDFNFGENKYKLIYAYEAFHLFSDKRDLIKRCIKALKPGGFLSIGWVIYEWDLPLKEEIEKTFASYGIYRGEWGLWTCPTFTEDVKASNTNATLPIKIDVPISAHTSVKTIIDFIFSNSKSVSLNKDLKPKIAKDLSDRFSKIYPSGESDGHAMYSFMYTQKLK